MDSTPLQVSLRDLTFILFKRKWSVITIIVSAGLVGIVWLWGIRGDVYEVSAKVLVKIGHEQAPSSTVLGAPPQVLGYRNQDVNSEVDILQSTELLVRVVDQLGLDKPAPPQPVPEKLIPRLRYYLRSYTKSLKDWWDELLIRVGVRDRLTPREKAIFVLAKGLLVSPQKDSNIVVAKLFVPFRENSNLILNTLLDLYLDFRLTLYQDQSAVGFFRSEVATISENLMKAEEELQAFEAASDITAIEKQKEVLLVQASDAQTALNSARIAMEEASLKVNRLEQEMKAEEPDFASLGAFERESFPESVRLQLASLQKERERLRMTELDNGPRIQNIRSQMQIFMGMLASNLRSVLAEKKATHQARAEALAVVQARLKSIHDKEMEWNALKRRCKVLEEDYLFYRKKLEDSSATATLERKHIGNVVVVEHAIDPFGPTGMRKTRLLGFVMLAGVLGALSWLSIAEFFDHCVYTPEVLESHLGAPVIGVIPVGKPRRIAELIGGVGTIRSRHGAAN